MARILKGLIAAFLLAFCHEAEAENPNVTASVSTLPEYSRLLLIEVDNRSHEMLCISQYEIDPTKANRLSISQDNARVYSRLSVDGSYRDYRSINADVPLFLVPHGETTFEYDLSDFPLKPGKITIHGTLKMATCASLFGPTGPRWLYVPVQAVREFPFR